MQETLRLMAEKGSASVSLTDIAEGAGIQKPSIYAHFSSREELVTAALKYASALQTAFPFSVDLTKSPEEILLDAARHYIALYCEPPLSWYFAAAESLKFNRDEKLNSMSEQFQDTLETQFSLLFETLDDSGRLRIADTDTASFLFASAFRTILCENISRSDTLQLEFETSRFVSSFLRLITPAQTGK